MPIVDGARDEIWRIVRVCLDVLELVPEHSVSRLELNRLAALESCSLLALTVVSPF